MLFKATQKNTLKLMNNSNYFLEALNKDMTASMQGGGSHQKG